jgi:hypothetical protein
MIELVCKVVLLIWIMIEFYSWGYSNGRKAKEEEAQGEE